MSFFTIRMKSLKFILTFAILVSIFPFSLSANMGIETKARITPPNNIDLRRLDLQNRLFRQEIDVRKSEFLKAREAFLSSTSDTRNIFRSEFRIKFVERFEFTLNKIEELQMAAQIKIDAETDNGWNTEASQLKLENSIELSAKANKNLENLKSLLSERYAEDERVSKKEQAKILVEQIKEEIKDSHLNLKESIKELRKSKSQETEIETDGEIELEVN
jgi:hypothetical protein